MFFSKSNKFNFKITVVSLVLVSTVIFLLPSISSAQILVPQLDGLTTADIKIVAGSIIQLFLGLLGLIALVIILIAGFKWMTSGGNEEKISEARKMLGAAVIGLLIILASYAITSFILESMQNALNDNGSEDSARDNFGNGFGGGALGGGIVEYHYPERDAHNIPRNTMIMITFKTEVDRDSVIGDSFEDDNTCNAYIENNNECGKLSDQIQISDSGNIRDNEMMIAVLTPDAKRILIKPIEPLGNADTNTYTSVHLTSDMKSATGNDLFPGLDNGYFWQFEVSNFLDLTPPEVTFVWPAQDETVARNAIVQMNFSEPINILSIDGNILIQENNVNLLGELKISNEYKTIEFLSAGDCGGVNINSCGEQVFCLPASSVITGIINDISDAADNIMPEEYTWFFNTNNTIDLDPPVITSVDPDTVNVQINPNPRISAIFDKIISPSSLNTDSLYIYNRSVCDAEEYEDEDGKNRISNLCFPAYSVYANQDNYKCNIKLYSPYLDQFSIYRPRLTAKIKDSYGNCFNKSMGPGGHGQQ